MTTLFFGLGPRGDVSEAALRAKLDSIAPIVDLRYRSTCAFCDVASQQIGEKIIRALHGTYIGSAKLSVSWAEDRHATADRRTNSAADQYERHRDRRDVRNKPLESASGSGRQVEAKRPRHEAAESRGDGRRQPSRREPLR